MNEKPKTFKEVEALVESGDVYVWIQEERGKINQRRNRDEY